MNETTKTRPKVCESCGETFGCGADASSCWCSEVSVTPMALERLKAIFDECLCPKCLAKEAENAEASEA